MLALRFKGINYTPIQISWYETKSNDFFKKALMPTPVTGNMGSEVTGLEQVHECV